LRIPKSKSKYFKVPGITALAAQKEDFKRQGLCNPSAMVPLGTLNSLSCADSKLKMFTHPDFAFKQFIRSAGHSMDTQYYTQPKASKGSTKTTYAHERNKEQATFLKPTLLKQKQKLDKLKAQLKY
jgi:hypothetical protein